MTFHKLGASTRKKLRSPGRPPVWQRENLCRFWQAIATGSSSEEAAVKVGVSPPVGVRWFRIAGGMPPTHLVPSAMLVTGHHLTFAEREEIALELARGTGIRAIARRLDRSPSTISREVRRNAATRDELDDHFGQIGRIGFTLQLTGSRVLQGNGALDSARRGTGRFAAFVRILMLQNLYL